MKYEKLFKRILIESKKQELFKKILREGEEESVDDILRAYRQNRSSEAYSKSQIGVNGDIHNSEHQIDITYGYRENIQASDSPKHPFQSYLDQAIEKVKTQKG
jgi:hypothetical protein